MQISFRNNLLLIVLIFSFAFYVTTTSTDTETRRRSRDPRKGCIIIYQHCNFKGKSEQICSNGSYKWSLGFYFHKQISSIKVGSNAQVILYSQRFYKGYSKRITNSNSCLINEKWNDMAQSLKVLKRKILDRRHRRVTDNSLRNPKRGCVIIYQHCYFKGKVEQICGTIYKPILGSFHKQISSIKIGSGVKIILYSRKNFKGSTKLFTHSDSCLINDGWNDKSKSLKTFRNKSIAQARNIKKNYSRNLINLKNPSKGCIIIYQFCNYKGKFHHICSNHRGALKGFEKLPNDFYKQISSLKIGPYAEVTLYSSRGYKGKNKRFTTTDQCLKNDRWQNKAKSLEVRKVPISL